MYPQMGSKSFTLTLDMVCFTSDVEHISWQYLPMCPLNFAQVPFLICTTGKTKNKLEAIFVPKKMQNIVEVFIEKAHLKNLRVSASKWNRMGKYKIDRTLVHVKIFEHLNIVTLLAKNYRWIHWYSYTSYMKFEFVLWDNISTNISAAFFCWASVWVYFFGYIKSI